MCKFALRSLLILLAAAAARAQSPAPSSGGEASAPPLFPFVVPWDDATPAVTDLSSWLDAPAGRAGFVTAKDGHLAVAGKRVRFFGVNLAFDANFPPHEDADKMAAHLAKLGVGCVRLHHMDTQPAPVGLLQADNVTLDPGQLDRLDYLVAALKKHGIYVDINLHVGRKYPGFAPWPGGSDYFKGVDNFDPKMIALQRDFARDLLTHVNPYTKTAYAGEPAVAFVEINNENSLTSEWWRGALDALPAVHADELRRQWNAWLTRRYGTDAKLRAAWNAGRQAPGAELLGDLKGFAQWQVERGGSANVSSEPQPAPDGAPGSVVHVQRAGAEAGTANFVRYHLPLDAGKAYTFTFQARADVPREINVSARTMGGPYKEAASVRVSLTTEWAKYRVAFVPGQSLGEARFGFTGFGAATGDLSFAGLSLQAGGAEGLPEGQSLGAAESFTRREFAGRTHEAQQDWIAFLCDTETGYWTGMSRYLKNDLHARSLVVGTPVGWSPFPIQAQLDVIDCHGYWQHPSFPHKPWDQADWTIKNLSMAGAPNGGVVGGLGLTRVAGKPFICTEYNGAAPNTYTSETFPLVCAYAAMQDWDALFVFAYSHNLASSKEGAFTNFFDLAQHPTKLATVPASVAMFVRGDVAAARARVVPVPSARINEIIGQSGPALRAGQFGVGPEETLRHPVQLALDGAASAPVPPVLSALPGVTSDTLDLRWTQPPTPGVVTVDTARSAGVVGFCKDETFRFGQVAVTPHATRQGWCTVHATVMEGRDFATAKRILVAATGYATNTGTKWKSPEMSSVGKDWGKTPSLVEGISATVTFPALPGAKAWALDERGARRAEVALRTADGKTVLEIGPEWKTLWYEIETAAR